MLRQLLFCLIILCTAHAAFAADPGECGTPEAMTAKLKAEDQHTLAFAQHLAPEKVIRGLLVTVNSDRSVGYVLQSDKRVGEKASQICIWNRLAKVRLFDARKPVPLDAYLKASDEEAARACEDLDKMGKIPRKGCIAFNKAVKQGDGWQHGVVLEALATERQADGTFRPMNSLVTLQMRIGGKVTDDPNNPAKAAGGTLYYTSFPDGATTIKAVVAEGEYTPYGLQAISGK
ncbi:MAG TPA: hypothetical protein VGN52_11315 [Burkholderiales bacterium]|jgi:hypothetical protein